MSQKRAMAGQGIPLYHKLRNGWQLYREHSTGAWGGVEVYVERYRNMSTFLTDYTGVPVENARILEMGCGQRAVMPMLFAAHGADAHGIDVEVPTYRMNPAVFARVVRRNGLERALKSTARHVLFDRRYFKSLQEAFGLSELPFSKARIQTMDVADLDYPDDHFDLVFSAAAFEHVADVDVAVRHLNRVLKPGGIAQIHAHLFASLSGGHCMDWQNADTTPSETVPPWDHLLENRLPPNTHLNKLRIHEFKAIFEAHTVIRRDTYSREGLALAHLAPPELLERYTIEELTTKGAVFVVSKKTG